MKFTTKAIVAAAVVAVAASAAPRVDAVGATVYTSSTDCTGSSSRGYATNNACNEDADLSTKVVCSSLESTSDWVFTTYQAANCDGAASETITGSGSDDCQVFSTVASIKIDCAATACFSGEAMVTLEGGAKVPMSQLNPGDRVLSSDESGNLFYDKVFRVTHWEQEATAPFVRLTTDAGSTLELTDSHYVHVNGLDAASLVAARDVKQGDIVMVVNDEGAVAPSFVETVETVKARGLFNVHTLSGRVVVNGIVASHFSEDTKWSGDSRLSVAPYWYKAVDFATTLFGMSPENARND